MLRRLAWIFAPRQVKEVYEGIVMAIDQLIGTGYTTMKPKNIEDIEEWEILTSPKVSWTIGSYVILHVILPYGHLALLFWRGRLIKHYYRKYIYVEPTYLH